MNDGHGKFLAAAVDGGDDVFRDSVGGVRPLKSRKPRVQQRVARPPVHVARDQADAAGSAATNGPAVRVGHVANLDRRLADRLRRGKLPIDARLDLHGHTQATAHPALVSFVTNAANAGYRCLLIVTGKGPVSQGGGVLRRKVPAWLNLPPCRGLVLAITESQPQHGGTGALYVLLRRRDRL